MALPDALADPVPLAILTLAVAAAVHYQRGLTWTEYRQIHRAKVRVFPPLQRLAPGGFDSFVNRKGGRDDGEYLVTRTQSVRSVWKQLVSEGGDPHLVASVKRRTLGQHPPQYSAAHVVWLHDDGSQTEAYLFANCDGTTDVYTHHETATTDVDGHLSDPQTNGDPKGVVRDALGMHTAPGGAT
jgi:hypothetical protein